ncbi:MAG: hypothetical protein WBM40_02635 [Thiohalocapsa sp.]
MLGMIPIPFAMLSVLIGVCSAAGVRDDDNSIRCTMSDARPRMTEAYADCMSDARGDVFAERSCEGHLE